MNSRTLDPRLPINKLTRSGGNGAARSGSMTAVLRALTTAGGGGISVGGGGGGGGGTGGSVTIGATPPSAPAVGDLWFDSVGTQLYIWYQDPTSSQWVVVVNQGGGVAGADESIQYNQGGKAGGDANLLWDYANQQMTIVSKDAQAGLTVQNGWINADGGFITDSTDYNAITALQGGILTGLLGVNGGGTGQQLSASQVRVTNDNVDNGIYLTCVGPSGGVFSAGAKYTGAQAGDFWEARDPGTGSATGAASMINLNGGGIDFYGNTGLTAGNTFLPSRLMMLDSQGNLALNPDNISGIHGAFIGPGTLSGLTSPCVPYAASINTLACDGSFYWQVANPGAETPSASVVMPALGVNGGTAGGYPSNSQVRVSNANVDNGLYITAIGASSGVVSAGARLFVDNTINPDVTAWMAREGTSGTTGFASHIALKSGGVAFYGDSGLIAGSFYHPTELMLLDNTGNLTLDNGKGTSVMSASGGFVTAVKSFNAIQALYGGITCATIGVNGQSQIPGTLPSASQVRVTNANLDNGLYLTCVGPSGGVISAGSDYSGSGTQWTGKDVGTSAGNCASMINFNGGAIDFYGDVGLNNATNYPQTPLFTPTLLMALDPSTGNLTLNPNHVARLSGASFVGGGTISSLTQNCVAFGLSATTLTDSTLFYWFPPNSTTKASASVVVPRLGVNGGAGGAGAYPASSQVRVSLDGTQHNDGLFITVVGSNNGIITAGASFDGLSPDSDVTKWLALTAAAAHIQLTGSVINFYGDSGLTPVVPPTAPVQANYYKPATPSFSYDGSNGTLTVKNLTVTGTATGVGGGGITGLTPTRVPYAKTGSSLADNGGLTWTDTGSGTGTLNAYTLLVTANAYNAVEVANSYTSPTSWGGIVCGQLGVNGANAASQMRLTNGATDSGMYLTGYDAHSAMLSAGISFDGTHWIGKDNTGGSTPGTSGVGTIFSQSNGIFHWYSNSNVPYEQTVASLTEMMSLDSQGNLVVGVDASTIGNLTVKGTITPNAYGGVIVNSLMGSKSGSVTAAGAVTVSGAGGITVLTTAHGVSIDGSGITAGGGVIAGLTAYRVPFAASATALQDSPNFTVAAANAPVIPGGAVNVPALGVNGIPQPANQPNPGSVGTTQVRVTATTGNWGLFLTNTIGTDANISAGCGYDSTVWNGSSYGSWVAHNNGSTVATIFQQYGGDFYWYSNSALTDGNAFAATLMMSLDSQGSLNVGNAGATSGTVGNLRVKGQISAGSWSGVVTSVAASGSGITIGGTAAAPTIANAGVLSIHATNTLTGAITLAQGVNITITDNNAGTITISAAGGAAGVTQITGSGGGAAASGAITMSGATGITVTSSASAITITGTAFPAFVGSLNTYTGAVTIVGAGVAQVTNASNQITITVPAFSGLTGSLTAACIPYVSSTTTVLTNDGRFFWESSTSSVHTVALGCDGSNSSQIRFSSAGRVNYGGYLTCSDSHSCQISAGCAFESGGWVARSNNQAAGSIFSQLAGIFYWYSMSNMPADGNGFDPTGSQVMSLDASGNLVCKGRVQAASFSGSGVGVTSVTASGSGISASPTTGAVVITNTGVTSVNGSTYIGVNATTGAVTITNGGVCWIAGSGNISTNVNIGVVTISMTSSPSFSGLNVTGDLFSNTLNATGNINSSGGTVSGANFATHGSGNASTQNVLMPNGVTLVFKTGLFYGTQ